MEINKDTCTKNIIIFQNLFTEYKYYENICINNINILNDTKEDLNKLIIYEDIDDTNFYKALIENSLYYLSKSIKLNQEKFINDFNNICIKLNKNTFNIIDQNNFNSILKEYKKISDNIINQNYNKYSWFKLNSVEELLELEKNINKILLFHNKIIKYFAIISELKNHYYCK